MYRHVLLFWGFGTLVCAISLAWPGSARGGTSVISVNFTASEGIEGIPAPLQSTSVAGVVAVDHWNNLTSSPISSGQVGGSTSNLINNSNVATTAGVTWSADNTWSYNASYSDPGSDPNALLMSSYLDNGQFGDVKVQVTNVPYAHYSVYVYFSDDNTSYGTTGLYTLTDGNGHSTGIYGRDPGQRFAGTFNQADGTSASDPNAAGNYMVFTGISTSGFSLDASVISVRAPIDGFQIVATSVPEPTSAVLLLTGGLFAAGLRFARRPTRSRGESH